MALNKTEIFEQWKSRIAQKKTEMNSLDQIKGWSRFKKYYRNNYADALDLKVPVTRINEVYSFVRTAVSSLFARNPRIRINPKRGVDLVPSQILEEAINYYWYKKKIKHQVKKCLKEAKLVGYSWMKVGYSIELGKHDGIEEETNEFIKSEDIFTVYVPHDRIWYDSESQDPPFDCRWMVQRSLKSTAMLRKKYGDDDIQATENIGFDPSDRGVAPQTILTEVDRERTWVYEVWDKDQSKVFVYIEGVEKFLEEKPWPEGVFEFPFVMLNFDEIVNLGEGNNLPDPELRAFEDQILEKIKIRSMQMEHIKRYNRQLLVDSGKLEDGQEEVIKRGEIAAVIKCNGDPNSVAAPLPYPQVPQDTYAIENRVDIDRDKISGQSSLEQGAPVSTKTRTLGEIEEITRGSAGRLAEQQDIVEEFVQQIASKMIQLMKTHFDEPQFIRISGRVSRPVVEQMAQKGNVTGLQQNQQGELQPTGLKFDKEDIQGEYDIEIVPGSTLPLNTQNRINQIAQLLRFGPAIGLVPGTLASIQLGKDLMEEMEMKEVSMAYEMDVLRMLEPKQPSPKEQLQMQQMKQNLQKGQKSIETADNRMASNTQSTIKKALDNAKAMDGTERNLNLAKGKQDLIKGAQDIRSKGQEKKDKK